MSGLRVLVMEDDGMIGILLAEVLTGMGHVCSIETTEATAVAAAVRCRPQLMIVDIRLGNGSGVSAVDEILRTGPLPHVFIGGDISFVLAHRPGAVALRKPFSELDLAGAIQRVLAATGSS